ncbi:MAG TPA: Rrf2 family transcriptional regulator [Longimicrobiales bacterium]|nr:Rrf2 family transcriptional regulator [Longimicrobiales bacterium]
MLSHTAEYALRAVLYIAQHETDDGLVRNDSIAAALDVPRNYLSKILHTLARDGLLLSSRGPSGGFRLARDPDAIQLRQVVAPWDAVDGPRSCILGRARCSDRNPCPAHGRWKDISEQVGVFFRKTTVGDLLREPGSLTMKTTRRSGRRPASSGS